ncbi:CDP-glucose 4,6-dehydratase [Marmoricola sp. URHA0025 HA25]
MAAATRIPSREFWRDRRVLVTGHTGFKGSWLTRWLVSLGAEVAGVALPELPSTPALWSELGLSVASDIRADIAGADWQGPAAEFDPQIVVHLAAQPLVSAGYADPLGTFETNVVGTAKLLAETPRLTSLDAVLVATTDKVYDTASAPPYVESMPLGGKDPYAASKAAAELVVGSWPRGEVPVVTARAGNVIGGGDWATDRLVPDLVRAWSDGGSPELRRPDAVRPWQHVLEPLCGYLVYLEELVAGTELPRALNFGPSSLQTVPVREVAARAAEVWGRATGEEPPPYGFAPVSPMKETQFLEIDSTLAASSLGWRSVLDWRAAVDLTIEWYARRAAGASADELVRDQLREFSSVVSS